MKKVQQRLFFLRKLKKAKVPSQLLVNFYRSIIENILCHCIIVWYTSCTIQNRRDLARIDCTSSLTWTTSMRAAFLRRLATLSLFEPLPSEKRYRAIRTRTNRLRNSFFSQTHSLYYTSFLYMHGHSCGKLKTATKLKLSTCFQCTEHFTVCLFCPVLLCTLVLLYQTHFI